MARRKLTVVPKEDDDRRNDKKTEQEIHEDREFLRGLHESKLIISDMAEAKGDLGALYKRMKDLGWSKKDFEYARSLENKDVGQVIQDKLREIRIAQLLGHPVSRQLRMLDNDSTPEVDRAFEAGQAAARLRKNTTNPYVPATAEYERWADGYKAGTAWINAGLNEAVNGSAATPPKEEDASEEGTDEGENKASPEGGSESEDNSDY